MRLLGTLALMTWLILLIGCFAGENEFRQSDRSRRLMAMAAEEAQAIDDSVDRLRQQLNIANMQIVKRRFLDGRKTLGHARLTIEAAEPQIGPHARLAGWVSISELSRAAGYDRFAGAACQEAIELLRSIKPGSVRCEYVRGVAQEVRKLRGKKAAVELLRKSAEWVAEIDNRQQRRRAYVAIASDLFGCDDYTGGRNVLRCDGDSKWRSDILTRLAKEVVPMEAFGKSVSFASYYYAKEDQRGISAEAGRGQRESRPATKPTVLKSHKTREGK